jgi:hypothetical protein
MYTRNILHNSLTNYWRKKKHHIYLDTFIHVHDIQLAADPPLSEDPKIFFMKRTHRRTTVSENMITSAL